jgi:GTP-binding protein Era
MEIGFKSGFVSIIGRPNVGKSTLLNRIVGEKISIISDKPQTTRHNILAVYHADDIQIVFTDTPGIHRPQNKLGEYMIKAVHSSLNEMDAVLLVVDAQKEISETERNILANLEGTSTPVILVINKIDLLKRDSLLPIIANYSSLFPFSAIVPVSALKDDGIGAVISELTHLMKDGPKYYPDDMVTDQTERELIAEIVREKLLWFLQKEVPHGVAIEILQMKDKGEMYDISANIYCEKSSHKGIIIGKNGELLKKIGTLSRTEMEKRLGKKVYLQLWVRVKEDWRNNNFLMKNLGFE